MIFAGFYMEEEPTAPSPDSELKEYLHSLQNSGAKLGLERVKRLLKELGNPQDDFKCILVGGTSGKGSTVAMLSSVLSFSGNKVGRFTSPHLSSLTERIAVDGEQISIEQFSEVIGRIKQAIERMSVDPDFEHPAFFEVITAAAFLHFQEEEVDFAVLEVGLGGRLDATNVTNPLVSVITNVSLEHTRILGDTVEKIALEKAGIIKKNGILVTASQDKKVLSVFEKVCKERKSKILRLGKEILLKKSESSLAGQTFDVSVNGKTYHQLSIPLAGGHQLENAACALGAVHALDLQGILISEKGVKMGLRRVFWPGRLEIIQGEPLVILDCAKDPEAMKRLAETVETLEFGKLVLVLGISSDKNIKKMVNAIVPNADLVIATAHKVMDRAANPKDISKEVGKLKKDCLVIDDVKEAVKKAISLAEEKDLILVTGSLFTVGEAREVWENKKEKSLGRDFNEVLRN